MKDFLPTIIALILLTILGSGYVYLSTTKEPLFVAKNLFKVKASEINKILITNKNGVYTLFKDENTFDDNWKIKLNLLSKENSTFTLPANLIKSGDLINILESLKTVQVLEKNGENVSEYGLSTPSATVKWQSKEGTKGKLILGNANEFASIFYCQTNNSATVKTVSQGPAFIFTESPMAFIDRNIVDLELENIASLTVDRKKDSFHMQNTGTSLFSVSYDNQPPCPAHPPAVKYLIDQLSLIKADAILEPSANQTLINASSTGLSPPVILITIEKTINVNTPSKITKKSAPRNFWLKIGSRVKDEEDLLYVMVSTSPFLYKVRAEQLLALASTGSEYKSTTLFSMPGLIYDFFIVTKPLKNGPPLKIQGNRKGDKWSLGTDFQKKLKELTAFKFYSKLPVSMEEAGLKPFAYSIAYSYNINPLNNYYIGQDRGKDLIYVLLPDQSVAAVDKYCLKLFSDFCKENR